MSPVTKTDVAGSDTSKADAERKTLVLTGASRGIGHATVKRFSRAGWRVITCSRQDFSDNCPWPAGPEDHIKVDLADQEDVGKAIAEIRRRLEADGSKLHALVNNAGISPKAEGGRRMNSIETPMAVWRDVFQVNFMAPIMLARGLFKELEAAQGSVVNVTSIAGSRVHPFAGTAYATSRPHSPRLPARWHPISAPMAFASMPSHRARSIRRSFRRERTSWWNSFPCAASARHRKWRKPYTSFAPKPHPM